MKKKTNDTQIVNLNLTDIKIHNKLRKTDKLTKDIQTLAESIKKVGLIEPILVCPAEQPGKFEIIAGQKRYLAHKKIDKKTIRSRIINYTPQFEIDAKMESLTESVGRIDLSEKDIKNAVLTIFKRYENIDLLIELTGFPRSKVMKYLSCPTLIPALQKMVDSGEVLINDAIIAQKAALINKKVNGKKAIEFAKVMTTLSSTQKKEMIKIVHDNPDLELSKILELVNEKESYETSKN